MTNKSVCFLALLGAAAIAVPLSAQAQSTGQQIYTERPAEYRDPVQTYLRMKEKEYTENHALLTRLGMDKDTPAIYEMIADRGMLSGHPVVGNTPEERASVAEALGMTVAQYLSSVGMTTPKIQASHDAGLEVVGSAIQIIAGQPQFADFMAVGEFASVGVVETATNNSRGITVTFRLTDGNFGAGSRPLSVTVQSNDVRPGQECVFFLSSALAKVNQARGPVSGPLNVITQQFQPYCDDGGSYRSTDAYNPDSVSRSEVLQLISRKKMATRSP